MSNLVPKKLCETLRLLVETTTMIYNWGSDAQFPHCSADELHGIRSFAGSQMNRALQNALHPTRVANSSIDQLAGLVFLLFGTMIAVSHTRTRLTCPAIACWINLDCTDHAWTLCSILIADQDVPRATNIGHTETFENSSHWDTHAWSEEFSSAVATARVQGQSVIRRFDDFGKFLGNLRLQDIQ